MNDTDFVSWALLKHGKTWEEGCRVKLLQPVGSERERERVVSVCVCVCEFKHSPQGDRMTAKVWAQSCKPKNPSSAFIL